MQKYSARSKSTITQMLSYYARDKYDIGLHGMHTRTFKCAFENCCMYQLNLYGVRSYEVNTSNNATVVYVES